jgi:V/A-type H+-transporting ATPase subunit I
MLRDAGAAARDARLLYEERARCGGTHHAFVLDGWVPVDSVGALRVLIEQRFSGSVVVEQLTREEWQGAQAPVKLRNPRLFRPFELVLRILPLPRYGSIDPTPFVAIFLPIFFGLMLGDVAYGIVLAIIATVLHRHTTEGTLLRAASEVAGACALFTILFGVLFGELLGDFGHRMLGMRPLLFSREEALVPFLVLAVGLGVVHVLLGLLLDTIAAGLHSPRRAAGRALTAVAVVLLVLALLALARVLPSALVTPAVIALVVVVIALIIIEGLIAPIELLSTVGRILSYARVMALGTASVMLAVVANRMVGALGSVLVGALFALVFHVINFAIGIFGPTIHALRLHYVEFFGTFYSPGGLAYRPFAHWKPDTPASHQEVSWNSSGLH